MVRTTQKIRKKFVFVLMVFKVPGFFMLYVGIILTDIMIRDQVELEEFFAICRKEKKSLKSVRKVSQKIFKRGCINSEYFCL